MSEFKAVHDHDATVASADGPTPVERHRKPVYIHRWVCREHTNQYVTRKGAGCRLCKNDHRDRPADHTRGWSDLLNQHAPTYNVSTADTTDQEVTS